MTRYLYLPLFLAGRREAFNTSFRLMICFLMYIMDVPELSASPNESISSEPAGLRTLCTCPSEPALSCSLRSNSGHGWGTYACGARRHAAKCAA